MDAWIRALGFWGVGIAALVAAIAIAVTPKEHQWAAWYVVLLLVLAGGALLGGTALAALQELQARPKLVFGEPFVEARGVVRIPLARGVSDSVAGTIPAATSLSASATGSYLDAVTTTHFDDRDRPAFFAYIPVSNQPRRRGRDAENVHARIRFVEDHSSRELYEIQGRWAEILQHGDPERILRGEEVTIPSNGSRRLLDVAFKYPDDDDAFVFNDENRFLAPQDLRYRSLDRVRVRIEVTLTGSNAAARGVFVLTHSGAGSPLEIVPA